VHAVGPYFHDIAPNKAIVELYTCIANTLHRVNDELCCSSVSIPAISSGLFGFPVKLCAETIFEAVENELPNRQENNLQEVKIVIIDHPTFSDFRSVYVQRYSKYLSSQNPTSQDTLTVSLNLPLPP
jgi:O-acetyl-ADP-ribose deacetylase (regulator of RNase III)